MIYKAVIARPIHYSEIIAYITVACNQKREEDATRVGRC